jgi:hypothetical protein
MSITNAAEASTQAVSPALIVGIGATSLGLQYTGRRGQMLSTNVERFGRRRLR